MFSTFNKLHFVFLCTEHSRLTSINVTNLLSQALVVNLDNAIYRIKSLSNGYLTTRETNCVIHWNSKVIYLMDSAIHFFNN